jgi:hypothetical protein
MRSLVDWLNEATPFGPPWGRLIVVVMLLALAALVARAAERIAALVIDRSDRRRNGDVADTGAITSSGSARPRSGSSAPP